MNDSVKITTDTTLDQDCVLKANKNACMYSVHDRVIVDNMSVIEQYRSFSETTILQMSLP